MPRRGHPGRMPPGHPARRRGGGGLALAWRGRRWAGDAHRRRPASVPPNEGAGAGGGERGWETRGSSTGTRSRGRPTAPGGCAGPAGPTWRGGSPPAWRRCGSPRPSAPCPRRRLRAAPSGDRPRGAAVARTSAPRAACWDSLTPEPLRRRPPRSPAPAGRAPRGGRAERRTKARRRRRRRRCTWPTRPEHGTSWPRPVPGPRRCAAGCPRAGRWPTGRGAPRTRARSPRPTCARCAGAWRSGARAPPGRRPVTR